MPGLQQMFNKCLLLLEFLEIADNVSSEMTLDNNKHSGTGFYALPEQSDPTTLDISFIQTLKGQSYVLHSHSFPPEASLWKLQSLLREPLEGRIYVLQGTYSGCQPLQF